MDHPWEDYDVAPTWRIILPWRTITIPSSLSINGGGVRGIIPSVILDFLEREL
ncbi:hypothetical protein HanHA300_Chr00c1162g0843471 [Helianthus annuus]|nr:hypothetical protein HanHA300_Chr04g0125251 [Helianthus annuus]KAJ0620313.1 hypothetical protein HanHA300_Chr00c1162g0843471 [Helianthus annuus]KAJ0760410.1 hypothetical protein HanOQP8_Chr04g0137671 [Helianthus annuus]